MLPCCVANEHESKPNVNDQGYELQDIDMQTARVFRIINDGCFLFKPFQGKTTFKKIIVMAGSTASSAVTMPHGISIV
jgi:hypothetical protein